MRPPITVIKICPCCGAKLKVKEYLSSNTFGSTMWSDTKIEAPMSPDVSILGRCSKCKELFWREDAKEINDWLFEKVNDKKYLQISQKEYAEKVISSKSLSDEDRKEEDLAKYTIVNDELARALKDEKDDIILNMDSKLESCQDSETLIEAEGLDYIEAIIDGKADTKLRERQLRVRYWWWENDKWRDKENKTILNRTVVNPENLMNLNNLLDLAKPNDRLVSSEIHRQLGKFDEAFELLKNYDEDYEYIVKQLVRFLVNEDRGVKKLNKYSEEKKEPTKYSDDDISDFVKFLNDADRNTKEDSSKDNSIIKETMTEDSSALNTNKAKAYQRKLYEALGKIWDESKFKKYWEGQIYGNEWDSLYDKGLVENDFCAWCGSENLEGDYYRRPSYSFRKVRVPICDKCFFEENKGDI